MTTCLLLLAGCHTSSPIASDPSCMLQSPGLLCTWKSELSSVLDLARSPGGGFYYASSCCFGELGADGRTLWEQWLFQMSPSYVLGGGYYSVAADPGEPSVVWVGGAVVDDGVYRVDGVSGVATRPSDGWRLEVESDEPSFLESYYETSALGFDRGDRLYLLVSAMEAIVRLEDGTVRVFAGRPTNFDDHPGMFDGDQKPATEVHLGLETRGGQYGRTSGFAIDDSWLYVPAVEQHVVVRIDLESGILDHVAGDPAALERWGGIGAPTPLPEEDVDVMQTDLHYPSDVALAPDGSVYVLEDGRACVRRFTVGGTIRTVAGICGEPSEAGEDDGAPATETRLSHPSTIAVDDAGNLYIGEPGTDSIRVVFADRFRSHPRVAR